MQRSIRITAGLAVLFLALFLLQYSGVAQSPAITVSPTQVNFFNVQSGGTSTQTVNVTSSTATTIFVSTAGSPSWLTVTPNGTVNVVPGSPTPLTVQVNASGTGLTTGTFSASFTVGVSGTTATPTTVNVTASVGGTSLLTASPSSLAFAAQPGSAWATPVSIPITISSSGSSLDYSVSASTTVRRAWHSAFNLSCAELPAKLDGFRSARFWVSQRARSIHG